MSCRTALAHAFGRSLARAVCRKFSTWTAARVRGKGPTVADGNGLYTSIYMPCRLSNALRLERGVQSVLPSSSNYSGGPTVKSTFARWLMMQRSFLFECRISVIRPRSPLSDLVSIYLGLARCPHGRDHESRGALRCRSVGRNARTVGSPWQNCRTLSHESRQVTTLTA